MGNMGHNWYGTFEGNLAVTTKRRLHRLTKHLKVQKLRICERVSIIVIFWILDNSNGVQLSRFDEVIPQIFKKWKTWYGILFFWIVFIITWVIDFSINWLSTENSLRSQRTPTPCKIKGKKCKFIYLERRIELTWEILMPRVSNFLRNSIIHIRTFLYLDVSWESRFRCYMLVTSYIIDTFSNLPYLFSEGRRNCSTLWPAQQRNCDSQETCNQI